MRKPDGCKICPLYADGTGFVPDEIVSSAKVVVYLQNPGENEERVGKPAIGVTGDILNSTFLPQAGLTRGTDVSVCNVLRCRWTDPATGQKINLLPPEAILKAALKHCRQYDAPDNGELIIAAGGAAWRAMGQPGSISEWRGFIGPNKVNGTPVLGVLHPADLFRDPKMKLPSMMDWRKVASIRSGSWPQSVPPVAQVPYTASVVAFVRRALEYTDSTFAVDTEYNPDTRDLHLIGIGDLAHTFGYQIWWTQLDEDSKRTISGALYQLFNRNTIIFQNSFADIPILKKACGIEYTDYHNIEDTMLAHAVLWSEWPHTLEFLASIYGKYPKMKHLAASNPSLYNWGDVLETISTHTALNDEFRRDPESRSIYVNQSLSLIPVLLKSMERGIKINTKRITSGIQQYTQDLYQARLMAQAHLGWPINLGSEKQLKSYLYGKAGFTKQFGSKKALSVGADAISTLRRMVGPGLDDDEESISRCIQRCEQDADPILEARLIYTRAQQILSHYLNPLQHAQRVYPQFKIHAQASGRWSTTDPPLAQLPASLRDILMPDTGDIWIGWDWDQIELRLLAALANDKPYLEAFKLGHDVHTINMCDIFNMDKPDNLIAPWDDIEWATKYKFEGKDDIRRVFAKRFVYRLNYGGDAKLAGDIPGAKVLGLGRNALVQASQRYLLAHPAMGAWRTAVAANSRANGISRTFLGRRRRMLGTGAVSIREAYNHPMQGGVSDILNICTVEIARVLPCATLVYTMHDSAWWTLPLEKEKVAITDIMAVVERVWNVQGTDIIFPATYKWRLDDGRSEGKYDKTGHRNGK